MPNLLTQLVKSVAYLENLSSEIHALIRLVLHLQVSSGFVRSLHCSIKLVLHRLRHFSVGGLSL